MSLIEAYLRRNGVPFRVDFPKDVALIITIPVYDDPEVFDTLESLRSCVIPEGKWVGILIVVNHAENDENSLKERNGRLFTALMDYTFPSSDMAVNVFGAFNLPERKSGVGAARKLAMDSAAAYFERERNAGGVIASLDADTIVAGNYCAELLRAFSWSSLAGVAIAFEHRLDSPACREAIVKYELYLRYYRHVLQYMGHPYAFYCIGSAFAVRAEDYVAVGGMNTRKAGEDFYFIQKLISTHRFAELVSTRVFPASRVSERTPFGTGRAVKSIMDGGGEWKVYSMGAFEELKHFFDSLEELYKAGERERTEYYGRQSGAVRAFLTDSRFDETVEELNKNTASVEQFRKRFFDSFNAFQVLKYLNYVHKDYFRKEEILTAAGKYLQTTQHIRPETEEEALAVFRREDM